MCYYGDKDGYVLIGGSGWYIYWHNNFMIVFEMLLKWGVGHDVVLFVGLKQTIQIVHYLL